MVQDNILWGLKIADGMTMELVSQMTVIASGVAVICFICNLSYNYLYHGVSQLVNPDESKFPDIMEIARCLALFFCITLYAPIAKTIVGTLEVINEATSLTADRSEEFAQYMARSSADQSEMISDFQENSLEAGIASGDDTNGAMQKEVDNLSQDNEVSGEVSSLEKISQLLNPGNMVCMGLHALSSVIAGIIQIVILGIGVVIIKLLVILGPFVFAFSMLPVFDRQLAKWFGTLCSVGMVFSVINILNQIMWFAFKAVFSTGDFDSLDLATKQVQYLGLDVAMIGSYCSCFWLASIIVGHGDAGKIITKTVSTLTSAATLAIGGAAIAKGATSVGAAASLGKSIIDEQ